VCIRCGLPTRYSSPLRFVAAERRPSSLQVVTLDERLADAMRKEGFAVVDIAAG
jgi:hypothetical protein